MAKYDEKFKLSIVQDYLLSEGGFNALSAKYSVSTGQIQLWTLALIWTFGHSGRYQSVQILDAWCALDG